MAVLVADPHHVPNRLPQPNDRGAQLGLELHHLPARRPPDLRSTDRRLTGAFAPPSRARSVHLMRASFPPVPRWSACGGPAALRDLQQAFPRLIVELAL